MRLILQISLRLNASNNSLNRWIDGKYEKEHFQKIRFKEGAIGIALQEYDLKVNVSLVMKVIICSCKWLLSMVHDINNSLIKKAILNMYENGRGVTILHMLKLPIHSQLIKFLKKLFKKLAYIYYN